jgi:glycosyltransferase involved in cell wall biosynthesis
MPELSVILSVYNGDRFPAAAVESILTQTYDDFEFLILDDGSRDRSLIFFRPTLVRMPAFAS